MSEESITKDLENKSSDLADTIEDQANVAVQRCDVFSFSDLDTAVEGMDMAEVVRNLTRAFNMLIANILMSDQITDKVPALKKVTSEFGQRLDAVVAEQSGQSTNESKSLLEKTKEFFAHLFKKETPKVEEVILPVKKENQMFIWKENDYYRWFALYSNCYRDNDNPPEIISNESHKKFVEMVDNKEVPYPELWHWHLKGSKYGQADWVAFDEDNGFAMASGYILPGHEQEAELMASKDLCVSHGMPSSSIVRDNTDKSVIIRHITAEISDLPTWAAANQLTQFSVFTKEIDETMTIPDNKKEYLKAVGLSDDKITQIENAAVNGKERADAEQRDSKEKTAEVTPVEPPVAEVKEVVTPNYVTKEEVAQAVGDVVAELAKSIKDMVDQMTALNARVIENEKKNKESVNLTPAASLSAMILGRAESAVGSKETLVRSNSPLLKDGPMEMQVADSGEGNDTSQIMNSIIRGIIAPKK